MKIIKIDNKLYDVTDNFFDLLLFKNEITEMIAVESYGPIYNMPDSNGDVIIPSNLLTSSLAYVSNEEYAKHRKEAAALRELMNSQSKIMNKNRNTTYDNMFKF